jgi:hypothetical protein
MREDIREVQTEQGHVLPIDLASTAANATGLLFSGMLYGDR